MLTVLGSVAIVYYWKAINQVQHYGYLGAFISGFIAGSPLPVPLPYLLLTFTLGGVLNPLLVGIVSGLGAGIGGTTVYLFGRGGGTLLFFFKYEQSSNSRVAKFVELAKRRGSLVVFLMSAAINPIFAPMAIAIGALGFRLKKFLFWCTLGNMVKGTIIAYAGYFGLRSLLRLLGAY